MADVDDFETLSDAELRATMLALGVPNIPVTDSSRKVLVKRLRTSIGGQDQALPAAAATPKKSSSAPSAAPAAASTPVDKLDGNMVTESPVLPSTSSSTRTNANELSDDIEAEDAQYASTFTRNLARLRAEKLGDRSSPYSRRTVASGSVGYEPLARRSLHPDDNSVSVTVVLEQKYHIELKLFIIFVVLLLIGVYSIFF